MPTPTISTLPTTSTVFTVHPDADGHSVWTFNYFGTGVKKIDLNTSLATLTWTFPYSGFPGTMEDGTVVFWQDSAGNVYLFTGSVSNFSTSTLKRLNPAAAMAETGSVTLAAGVLNNGPEQWVVYQSGGQDFVAVICNQTLASSAKWAIINLTTMTLVGNGALTNFQAAGNNERGWGTFKDATGNIWFVTTTLTAGVVTPHFYKSVANGTPTFQFTVPGTTTNFSNPSFAAFVSYDPSTNLVFIGDNASITGSNGFTGDMVVVNLGTQAVSPISKNVTPFTKFYSGTFDPGLSAMRRGFSSVLPSGSLASTICVPGDVADAGATQRGGVANFFSPSTLALQETYNVTQLIKSAGFTPPTYSDSVRGTVTAPNAMLLWFPSLTKMVVTYDTGGNGSSVYVLNFTVATPDLSVSPASLSFTVQQGRANPAPQTLSVTNVGTGTLAFTDTSDAAWLSAAPASGTAPQNLTVSVTLGVLTAGTYTGHITVTSAGSLHSPQVIPVTLVVTPGLVPVNFVFFDPSGAPLAGGKVVAYLNADIALNGASGSQIMAKRVEATLDSNGSSTVFLWPNSGLQPPNSVYFVEAYTALGQPVWLGQITV